MAETGPAVIQFFQGLNEELRERFMRFIHRYAEAHGMSSGGEG